MPKPLPTYYQDTTTRVGVVLTNQQIEECEELGILVENDDQGVLLQIFIKPIGDRYVLWLNKVVIISNYFEKFMWINVVVKHHAKSTYCANFGGCQISCNIYICKGNLIHDDDHL